MECSILPAKGRPPALASRLCASESLPQHRLRCAGGLPPRAAFAWDFRYGQRAMNAAMLCWLRFRHKPGRGTLVLPRMQVRVDQDSYGKINDCDSPRSDAQTDPTLSRVVHLPLGRDLHTDSDMACSGTASQHLRSNRFVSSGSAPWLGSKRRTLSPLGMETLSNVILFIASRLDNDHEGDILG